VKFDLRQHHDEERGDGAENERKQPPEQPASPFGFLRDGIVFINEDLAHGASVELRQTVLEELSHYLTGSKDCTRDLQDWAFKLAVRLAMAMPVERSAAA
jgi:hypothetical protein